MGFQGLFIGIDQAAGAVAIDAGRTRLTWLAPRRAASASGKVLQAEEAGIWTGAVDDHPCEVVEVGAIQGGRKRGLILHKLMEEVLTGETNATATDLIERAGILIRAPGHSPVANPATDLSAEELAGCVLRILALPEITALWPALRGIVTPTISPASKIGNARI